ncbi:MAG: hypothetical protein ACD_3C00040G0003 [uncultured bacterium (gcode 4)]|uniref:YkuD domain-containing protein n=1 Tax=uncultured bacterium (gcode 4) TaxID=1234023 RepID=K2G2V3_9BACT|nr:MAG: hypothetical protein ACD_3C00040G0003 [uncultured bacterium (gcode 4)]
MNYSKIITIWAFATWLLAFSWVSEKARATDAVVNTTKENVDSTLSWNTVDLNPNTDIAKERATFSKKISEMKWTPLEMRGIFSKNSLKQFLWLNQYEVVFEKYNKDMVKYRKDWKIDDSKELYLQCEIYIPRIYDELTEYFPETLDEYINNTPKIRKNVWNDRTLIIISKVGNWKFALAYYQQSKLFLATHVSPWDEIPWFYEYKKNKKTWKMTKEWIPPWHYSPSWTFKLTKNDYEKFKRSRKFKASTMPYAIHVYKWVFFHHWVNVDWWKKSHWCIRVPWFYQEELYNNVKSWTKIIISDTKN